MDNMKEAVAILCAGGPAPGINTVISSVTKIFINNGYNVGIHVDRYFLMRSGVIKCRALL